MDARKPGTCLFLHVYMLSYKSGTSLLRKTKSYWRTSRCFQAITPPSLPLGRTSVLNLISSDYIILQGFWLLAHNSVARSCPNSWWFPYPNPSNAQPLHLLPCTPLPCGLVLYFPCATRFHHHSVITDTHTHPRISITSLPLSNPAHSLSKFPQGLEITQYCTPSRCLSMGWLHQALAVWP